MNILFWACCTAFFSREKGSASVYGQSLFLIFLKKNQKRAPTMPSALTQTERQVAPASNYSFLQKKSLLGTTRSTLRKEKIVREVVNNSPLF
ncbi:hypothetical protein [Riemerella columbina]|uniref:hypothetical protein n=1 Tax=Riemerella columbina TaxID=103810 RepID=UPI00266FBC25|nr:hypothetical protein [Riemerella columbina]WKS95178.1 hypothetical protein NYR17_00110 [Riemerella columbina]